MRLGLIDYGMGNLRSAAKALERCGQKVVLLPPGGRGEGVDGLVLPGVGAFDDAVLELKRRKWFGPLKDWIAAGKPFLGFCLGLQLLFERSDEGREEGLGVLKGFVRRFPRCLKVPHMGWNQVSFASGSSLRRSGESLPFFYFVHSYFAVPRDSSCVAGTTNYGVDFASVVTRKGLIATQFHPEKSQGAGLSFLRKALTELEHSR